LNAASLLLNGNAIDLVTVDMPLATVPIAGRREADAQISRNFGAAGCATHSPSSERPGKISETLKDGFLKMGFALSTLGSPSDTRPCLLEVYPHPAILRLLNLKYRLPYKVSKSAKYWPKRDSKFRIVQLLSQFNLILAGLRSYFENIPLDLPQPEECGSLSYLKRYEDAIDALVCAWVGICFIENSIQAFGDVTAAIWVPTRLDESLALPAYSHFPTKIKVVRRRRRLTLH
jgi:predicted RNase H-like nuclease